MRKRDRKDTNCPYCSSQHVKKDGVYISASTDEQRQKYKCLDCSKKFSVNTNTLDAYGKQGVYLNKLVRFMIEKEFCSLRDIQRKLRVNRRTVMRSLRKIALERRAIFTKAEFYRGFSVTIEPMARNEELSQEPFSVEVKLGFTKMGPIIDASLGRVSRRVDKDWAEKHKLKKWLSCRSEEWLEDRLALFCVHYNAQLLKTQEQLRKFQSVYPSVFQNNERLQNIIRSKRGNRHKSVKSSK